MKSLLGDRCQLTVRAQNDGDYSRLDGLAVTKLEISNNPVDVTNGASDGWRELLSFAGSRHVTVALSGISLGGAAEFTLQACALSGELVDCQLVATSAQQLQGCFAVKQMSYSGQQGEEVVFDLALTSAGPITLV